jgi:type VI secretion system ImpC/EvpB family protein
LVGGPRGKVAATTTPVAELVARIVAPNVVAAPSAETPAMIAAVDMALSTAMRLILHSPEFQTIESAWRSLDLLARRIETDQGFELFLYDVSAEELAVDLAAVDDLANGGLFRLLSEGPMADDDRGGFSALIGLYVFEETPPHAELLARLAKVAAHVGAPFFTAISPEFLSTPASDRHPLVINAWNALRTLPEARYLGVATPRFLLRRPYGKRSEPIDSFAFEEFTPREGLRCMLWSNPAVLVAILLADSRGEGETVKLGSVMSIDGMPYHYMTDEHGDQVALPCTERHLIDAKAEVSLARGFMPVLSLRGRDEVRLGSFQSISGNTIVGPWRERGGTSPAASAPVPTFELTIAPAADASRAELDAFLKRFGDAAPETDSADMDAGLAALLKDLR